MFEQKVIKSSLWRGPYTVLDKVTNVNYKIQLIGSTKCQNVHANRLKLYYGHPEPGLQQISRNDRNAGRSRSNQPDDASGHLILEEENEEEAPVHGEEEVAQEGTPRNENERGEDSDQKRNRWMFLYEDTLNVFEKTLSGYKRHSSCAFVDTRN